MFSIEKDNFDGGGELDDDEDISEEDDEYEPFKSGDPQFWWLSICW